MIDTHGEVQLNAIEKLIVTSNLQNFYAGLHILKTVKNTIIRYYGREQDCLI